MSILMGSSAREVAKAAIVLTNGIRPHAAIPAAMPIRLCSAMPRLRYWSPAAVM